MKLAKLSLAAITVASLTASAFAADSLASAFKEGKISGTITSFYLKTTKDAPAVDSGAYALGGLLNFQTAKLNGFYADFEFQASDTLGTTVGDVNDGSIGINNSMLSQAYLGYYGYKTDIKVGRMHIGTPLVSDSGSRLVRDYWNALLVVNKSLKNTTIAVGGVTEWTGRDGSHFRPADPIYTVLAATSFSGVSVTGQYVYANNLTAGANDTRKDYYVGLGYTVKAGMPIKLGAQYIGFTQDGAKSLHSYGLMVGTSVAGLGLSAYYTNTSGNYGDGSVPGGYGNGSDPSYNSVQKLSGNGAGVTAYQGKVSYDFSKVGVKGLSAFTRYIQYNDYSGSGLDANEWDMDAKYAFGGSLKGLSGQVRYATVTKDVPNSDFNDFRFIVKYKF
ncbi:MAG: OprD family outer membrane porin [Sulfurospirillum sp.]